MRTAVLFVFYHRYPIPYRTCISPMKAMAFIAGMMSLVAAIVSPNL
jgi:hypothetical protein